MRLRLAYWTQATRVLRRTHQLQSAHATFRRVPRQGLWSAPVLRAPRACRSPRTTSASTAAFSLSHGRPVPTRVRRSAPTREGLCSSRVVSGGQRRSWNGWRPHLILLPAAPDPSLGLDLSENWPLQLQQRLEPPSKTSVGRPDCSELPRVDNSRAKAQRLLRGGCACACAVGHHTR